MRSHISVHPATTKYFSISFIFKNKIEKEGLPKDSPAGLGAGGPRFKSGRPDHSLTELTDFPFPRYSCNSPTWEHLGTIASRASSQRLFVHSHWRVSRCPELSPCVNVQAEPVQPSKEFFANAAMCRACDGGYAGGIQRVYQVRRGHASDCFADAVAVAVAVVDDGHSGLLDEVILEVVNVGDAAGTGGVAVAVVGVARREAVVGVIVPQPCWNWRER